MAKKKVTRKVTKSRSAAPKRRKAAGFKLSSEQAWMIGAGVLLVALGVWSLQRTPTAKLTATQVSSLFQKQGDLGSRVSHFSAEIAAGRLTPQMLQAFSGAPRVSDNAPLVADRLNCTTFVETVAALARAKNSASFYSELLAIRYRDGKPTFQTRNHFPEADWITANQKNGRLEDVTSALAAKAGTQVAFQEKTIEKAKWLEKEISKGRVARSIASAATKTWDASVNVKLGYIPVSEISKVNLPEGAVINIVRESVDRNPVLITHQGLAVKQGGKTFIRHANVDGTIRTSLLSSYITTNDRPSVLGKIVGINVNQWK